MRMKIRMELQSSGFKVWHTCCLKNKHVSRVSGAKAPQNNGGVTRREELERGREGKKINLK